MKKLFLTIIATAVFIAVIGYFVSPKSGTSPLSQFAQKALNYKVTVKIDSVSYAMEIADTEKARRLGLSGRNQLQANQGMLFTFQSPVKAGFWMKDMNFPIDIIWVREGKITGIEKNAQPMPGVADANLKLYYSPDLVDRVIEINAGDSDKHSFKIGDMVELPN